jgi:hypothetical protein
MTSTVTVAYLKDLAERVAATWAQAFLATLVMGGWFSVDQITNLSILQKAAVAGIAAVIALAKGLVVKVIGVGDPATAGVVTLPRS